MGKLLAFGEVMLRLSPPGRELLMQSLSLDLWVGGAEVSVATALARLGKRSASRRCYPTTISDAVSSR